MNQDGIWLSVLEYASVKKISISTIRRSIKSGIVKYKEENGKYFIWTKEIKQNSEIEFLKRQNRELLEEINDLKMLLSVYEARPIMALPPLPEIGL